MNFRGYKTDYIKQLYPWLIEPIWKGFRLESLEEYQLFQTLKNDQINKADWIWTLNFTYIKGKHVAKLDQDQICYKK